MTKKSEYLATALSLTALEVVVVVHCDWPIWASSGDIWNCGVSALLAALGVIPSVNLWVQAAFASDDQVVVTSAAQGEAELPVLALDRGQANV
jgi:hypothetical protein